jgi:hypothetical protein
MKLERSSQNNSQVRASAPDRRREATGCAMKSSQNAPESAAKTSKLESELTRNQEFNSLAVQSAKFVPAGFSKRSGEQQAALVDP